MNRAAEMPVAVAITGGIGCGKSEVARILREEGVPVLDADDVARDVVKPGGDAAKKIAARFGAAVMQPDGSVNRRRLAEIVFCDENARKELNAIVHPPVRAAMREWRETQHRAGSACVGVIPLLYETGADREWDEVVCVASSADVSRARLGGRGWSEDEISRRQAAQMGLDEKRKRAGFVIENDGSLAELAARVRAVWNEILKKERRNGR